jgi:threonine aldolase
MPVLPVDLRSDTVTKPSDEMRRAMATAEVGDDQYGEDPTVNLLQETFAEMTGKEAALFVPSGTMGNQLALLTLTRPGDAVVVGARQHVVLYEGGAGPANAGITWLAVDDDTGPIDPATLEAAIQATAHHQPAVAAVAVEDTHMAAGGMVWPLTELDALAAVASTHGIPVHLDGARLWHAAVATNQPLSARAAPATTVMSCLSKGLAAPVGSLLAGPADVIGEARGYRKRLGGAMRQAGVIAAAGLVALRQGIDRLAEDHARAHRLAEAVGERWPDSGFDPARVHTNIVVFSPPDADGLIDHLAEAGILAGTVAPGVVRLVTHVDVDEAGIDLVCKASSNAPGL